MIEGIVDEDSGVIAVEYIVEHHRGLQIPKFTG